MVQVLSIILYVIIGLIVPWVYTAVAAEPSALVIPDENRPSVSCRVQLLNYNEAKKRTEVWTVPNPSDRDFGKPDSYSVFEEDFSLYGQKTLKTSNTFQFSTGYSVRVDARYFPDTFTPDPKLVGNVYEAGNPQPDSFQMITYLIKTDPTTHERKVIGYARFPQSGNRQDWYDVKSEDPAEQRKPYVNMGFVPFSGFKITLNSTMENVEDLTYWLNGENVGEKVKLLSLPATFAQSAQVSCDFKRYPNIDRSMRSVRWRDYN